jgi:hypothetical protein
MENVTMKKLMMAAMLAAVALSSNVYAHGAKPKHGGIVQAASDLTFELVTSGDTAKIYVEDHGKPFATNGATGKLTVLNGAGKTETTLQAGSDNTLEAKGVSKLTSGTKAVATINFPEKKTVNVRFSVK